MFIKIILITEVLKSMDILVDKQSITKAVHRYIFICLGDLLASILCNYDPQSTFKSLFSFSYIYIYIYLDSAPTRVIVTITRHARYLIVSIHFDHLVLVKFMFDS